MKFTIPATACLAALAAAPAAAQDPLADEAEATRLVSVGARDLKPRLVWRGARIFRSLGQQEPYAANYRLAWDMAWHLTFYTPSQTYKSPFHELQYNGRTGEFVPIGPELFPFIGSGTRAQEWGSVLADMRAEAPPPGLDMSHQFELYDRLMNQKRPQVLAAANYAMKLGALGLNDPNREIPVGDIREDFSEHSTKYGLWQNRAPGRTRAFTIVLVQNDDRVTGLWRMPKKSDPKEAQTIPILRNGAAGGTFDGTALVLDFIGRLDDGRDYRFLATLTYAAAPGTATLTCPQLRVLRIELDRSETQVLVTPAFTLTRSYTDHLLPAP